MKRINSRKGVSPTLHYSSETVLTHFVEYHCGLAKVLKLAPKRYHILISEICDYDDMSLQFTLK
jgi:hypothetical protein